jgi:hypothetical protein
MFRIATILIGILGIVAISIADFQFVHTIWQQPEITSREVLNCAIVLLVSAGGIYTCIWLMKDK